MAGDEKTGTRGQRAGAVPDAKSAPAKRAAAATRRGKTSGEEAGASAKRGGARTTAKAEPARRGGKAQTAGTATVRGGTATGATRRGAGTAASAAGRKAEAGKTTRRKAEPAASTTTRRKTEPAATTRRKTEPAATTRRKSEPATTTRRRKTEPAATTTTRRKAEPATTKRRKAEPAATPATRRKTEPATTRRKAEAAATPATTTRRKAAGGAKKAEPAATPARRKAAPAAKATTRRKATAAAAGVAAAATTRKAKAAAAPARGTTTRAAAAPATTRRKAAEATARTGRAAAAAPATETTTRRRATATPTTARRAGAAETRVPKRETPRAAKAEAEQQAAAERNTARRAKAEAEQQAAAERKTARRAKVEAEQQAAAERKTARRAKAEAETAAAAERKARRRAETPIVPAAEEKPARARRRTAAPEHRTITPAPVEPRTPTPIVEGPVEGKGRHTIADPAAVAELLGDARDTSAPLSEVLPPDEPFTPEIAAPEEAWRLERERHIREREERRAERMRKQAETRAERKRAREEAAPAEAPRGERGAEVVGTITVRPEGYGFLKRLEGPPGDDIFLPPDELRGVMDGDRLRVRIVRGRFGRDAGQLLEVLERRRRHLVGTFYRRDRTTYVIPVDPTLPRFVPVRARGDIRDGQVVKVAITQYPEEGLSLLGDVEKVIGNPGDPIVEVLEVAYSHGFAEDFPVDVRDESEGIPDHVRAEDKFGRRDLTKMRLVTIDGADARDFDDAVYVERRGHGYRLVVAIADVAHYVRPGARLDEEALHRATSVYFPNHVLPMLPERLSNGICSLNPKVERLCMVADVLFDSSGRPESAEIYEGVMWSHARCTYEQVAQLLKGEDVPELAHVKDDLVLAGELALKLRHQRSERGSLDFDLPEAKPILDENMQVVEIARRDRNDAHRLIEEFMLAANEAVARYFGHLELPTVYRVHGQPNVEKLQNFVNLASTLGFFFDLESGVTPVKLGQWLREIEGSAQQKALNTLLLRSMMQAVYTPENIGHFGLGAEHYLHFTSPIRRYPDLVVHRLLKQHWARGERVPTGAALEEMEEKLADLAAQSSQRERAAMEAEREIDAYFKCLFVQDKVGEVFGATITSITDFGFFAELEPYPVEGLVRAEELGTAWELDEGRHRLVFGSGRSFGIGERVEVEIAGVDLVKRQIAFVLVADQEGEQVVPIRPRAIGGPRPRFAGGQEARGPRFGGGREGGGPRFGGGREGGREERFGKRGGRDEGREPRGPREDRFGGGGRRDDRFARGGGRDQQPQHGGRFGGQGGDRFAGGRGSQERSGTRPWERHGNEGPGPLTDAIDRFRAGRGPKPGPGAAPTGGGGSRFAAGDRGAAWRGGARTGPFAAGFVSQGGFAAQAPEEGGGKGKKGKKKGRPGKKERAARKRR